MIFPFIVIGKFNDLIKVNRTIVAAGEEAAKLLKSIADLLYEEAKRKSENLTPNAQLDETKKDPPSPKTGSGVAGQPSVYKID